MALIEVYMREMTKIMANESLRQAAVVAVGTGSMKEHDIASTLGRWKREAMGQTGKPVSKDQMKGLLSKAGIGFRDGNK